MSEKIRPAALFKIMEYKVLTLIKAEAKMNQKERGCQQWQLFFQIKGFGDYLVGKGGINTMFYTVNGGERVLCYPNDMLELIAKWAQEASVTRFVILNPEGKEVRTYPKLEEAKEFKAKAGYFIAKIAEGKRTKLFVRKAGLVNKTWKAIEK